MPSNRIVYQNWIVELGRDPEHFSGIDRFLGHEHDLVLLDDLLEKGYATVAHQCSEAEEERVKTVRRAVTEALGKLSDDEREFLERFYFMGQTYRQISEKSGRAIHRLEAVHKRAAERLRKELWPTVEKLYSLSRTSRQDCDICCSAYREQIDLLISRREESATWRPVMKEIRKRYGLKVSSPQVLIGHQKYH